MSNLIQKKKRIGGSHLCVFTFSFLETLNEGLSSEPCERSRLFRLLSEYGKRHASCLSKFLKREEFKIVHNHIKQPTQSHQGLTEWMKMDFYEMLSFGGDPVKLYYRLTCPYSEMNKVMHHRKLSWAVMSALMVERSFQFISHNGEFWIGQKVVQLSNVLG